jgi:hypothetical protein
LCYVGIDRAFFSGVCGLLMIEALLLTCRKT